MQIVYHLGAHVTDEALLVQCLEKNAERLAQDGIALSPPDRFRAPLAEALSALRAGPISEELETLLIDALIDEDDAQRVVMSVDSFLCPANQVLGDNRLYPKAGERIAQFRDIFPSKEVEFHFALRNPATFLPALATRAKASPFQSFIDRVDPMVLRWSDVVERMAAAAPDCRLVVWCNEDTPLIWPEVLREVSGHDPATRLKGTHRLLERIMTREALNRLMGYLDDHPPKNETQRRHIVAAFLDRFALEDEMEMELGDTGWTAEYVDALSAAYDEDVHRIECMAGVTFIAP
ncbi:hypothetical protein DDZ14_18665 [Maritimibacter sp. 55A14]|uniref:hypothetical protein n=1 Tax=Maritimibacter sp. 55A14 TaxID=2174844 RepID=UPI000D604F1D|nr:hypothetical protein [Maritimibacter sp. 55A14]PWE28789.1 hypothetical protein DDZ14_18665 [Maritimibacter sp. 55A14]